MLEPAPVARVEPLADGKDRLKQLLALVTAAALSGFLMDPDGTTRWTPAAMLGTDAEGRAGAQTPTPAEAAFQLPTIVYTATVKAAESVRGALVGAGVSSALYHGRLRAASATRRTGSCAATCA